AATTLMPTEIQAHTVWAVVRAAISSPKAVITKIRTRYSTYWIGRSAGFGAWTEGVALLPGPTSVGRGRRRASVAKLAQAGLEEGLQAGAVLALERAQLVDL